MVRGELVSGGGSESGWGSVYGVGGEQGFVGSDAFFGVSVWVLGENRDLLGQTPSFIGVICQVFEKRNFWCQISQISLTTPSGLRPFGSPTFKKTDTIPRGSDYSRLSAQVCSMRHTNTIHGDSS